MHRVWPSFGSRFQPPQHAHKDKQGPTFGSKIWGQFCKKLGKAAPSGRAVCNTPLVPVKALLT